MPSDDKVIATGSTGLAMTAEEQVLARWHQNASPWITAIRNQEISSRKLATDQAIVSAVLATRASTVLDVGCGEGWLVRALEKLGMSARGVDAVPALIDEAARLGGEFAVASYEDIAAGKMPWTADAVCCNFALIGKESVEQLFRCVPSLLQPQGHFIVQTLHSQEACGDQPYEDGWREGSWTGFNSAFKDAPRWYFRTLESWRKLFADSGLQLVSESWPIHPTTGRPASVVFCATAGR